jgi:enediyne biosynthesis protein E4
LPMRVQTSPVNGIVSFDVNADGLLDVIMIGNDYGNEVNMGRYDAFTGAVLINKGKGQFGYLPVSESGFSVPGDGKAIAHLPGYTGNLFVSTQNRDSLMTYKLNTKFKHLFRAQHNDQYAEILYQDGTKSRVEFYYGSGYLSQSARVIPITENVVSLTVVDRKGNVRKIKASLFATLFFDRHESF